MFVYFEIHSCAVYLLFSCVSRQFLIGIALHACLFIESFYLIPIEQLLHFVEHFDQLEVSLPCSWLLTGIPKLAWFQNLRCSHSKMTLDYCRLLKLNIVYQFHLRTNITDLILIYLNSLKIISQIWTWIGVWHAQDLDINSVNKDGAKNNMYVWVSTKHCLFSTKTHGQKWFISEIRMFHIIYG